MFLFLTLHSKPLISNLFMRLNTLKCLLLAIVLLLNNYARGQCRYAWASWTNIGLTRAATASLIVNGQTIGMTMTANYDFDFTPSIYSYSKFSGFNDPPANSTVPRTTWTAGVGGETRMCFSQPVVNPVLLFSSIGQPGKPVNMSFSLPYKVVYDGGDMEFTSPTALKGEEGYCIVEFPGTFTCITIYSSAYEYYTNITWGIKNPITAGYTYTSDCSTGNVSFSSATSFINPPGMISSYNWDFGDGNVSSQPDPVHHFTSPGLYNVQLIITSDNGCKDTITRGINTSSVVRYNNTQQVCEGFGYTIGTHTYTASGIYQDTFTSPGFCDSIVTTYLTVAKQYNDTLLLTLCDGDSVVYDNGSTIKNAGFHTFHLSSVHGCDSIVTINLVLYPPLSDSLFVTKLSCKRADNGIIRIIARGGTPPYLFSLQGRTDNDSGYFSDLGEGSYGYMIRDKNLCNKTGSVELSRPEQITVWVDPPEVIVPSGKPVQLTASCNLPNATFKWSGSTTAYLSCTDCASPVLTPVEEIDYTVTATTLIDSDTCSADTVLPVKILTRLFVPNVFTPNGDDANEHFRVFVGNFGTVSSFEVVICNAWGQIVYTSRDPEFKWDGKHDGIDGPQGVYAFVIRYAMKNNPKEEKVLTGNVTLLR
jgi:gliding motility-associated-like protein